MFPIPWNFPFKKKDGTLTTVDDAISAGGGGGGYTLPTASASTKGGVKIGNGLSMSGEVLNNSNPTPYSLPTASGETLGGVKVGSGLTISDGVLNNSNPTPYSLPTASAETLGGVKVGNGLTIADGVLSAIGGSSIYNPTLETGVNGFIKFEKDANGFINVAGAVTLDTPMTDTRVKLINGINSEYQCGTNGYQWGATWAVGIDSSFNPHLIDVRFYGSGNVWLYPDSNSTSITYVLISGMYRNDVYVTT